MSITAIGFKIIFTKFFFCDSTIPPKTDIVEGTGPRFLNQGIKNASLAGFRSNVLGQKLS